MKLLPDGLIHLERGSTVPVVCDCGNVYRPMPRSTSSLCLECFRTNEHSKLSLALVEAEPPLPMIH